MTYYIEGFSTNEVAGAIAAAALHDLHVNNFSFQGFPGVQVAKVGAFFEIRLSSDLITVGPLVVPFPVGKRLAKAFRAKIQIEQELFKKVQGLLVDLERKASEQ